MPEERKKGFEKAIKAFHTKEIDLLKRRGQSTSMEMSMKVDFSSNSLLCINRTALVLSS